MLVSLPLSLPSPPPPSLLDAPAASPRLDLDSMLFSSEMACLFLDADGRVLRWNHTCERLLAVPADEAVGRLLSDILGHGTVSRLRDQLACSMARTGQLAVHATIPLPHNPGASVDVSVRALPVSEDPSGMYIVARGLHPDEVSQAHHSRFWELASDFMAVIKPTGEAVAVNPALRSVCGLSASDRPKYQLRDLIHPDDHARVDEVSEALGRGRTSVKVEMRLLSIDGTRPVSWQVRAQPDGLIYAVGRDITDRRAREELAQRRSDELARSNADLEAFASVASHDLQEPARTIEMCAQVLAAELDESLTGDTRELLGSVVAASRVLTDRVRSLLQLARADRYTPPAAPVRADDAVDDALAAIAAAAGAEGAQFVRAPLPGVLVDRAALADAIGNLLCNAIKFTAPDRTPVIEISGSVDGDVAVIEIADNGPGIPDNAQQSIFEAFNRGGVDHVDGLGLGLATVRRICERHDGTVTAANRPDGGAKFTLTFPAP